jgi:hypothetical protein
VIAGSGPLETTDRSMPIFSNRSAAQMLTAIAQHVGPHKVDQLKHDLSLTDSAIGAEWELAVMYCLSKQGRIECPAKLQRQGDLDVIYTAQCGERVAIEVTAVSDAENDKLNPVDDFSAKLRAFETKHGISGTGVLRFDLGYSFESGRCVLGIPTRGSMDAFFTSEELRAFARRTRANPSLGSSYQYSCRGSTSRITYVPGAKSGGGGHIATDVIFDLDRNAITSRLESKHRQVKRSRTALPCVVILCDGDCRVFRSELTAFNRPTVGEVIDVWLNGREHQQFGPWLVQKGRKPQTQCINAVGVLSIRDRHNWILPRPCRCVHGAYVVKTAPAKAPLSSTTLEEIMSSFRALPRVDKMPYNARRAERFPALYGAHCISTGPNKLTIKFSVLTLQKLLAGHISYEHFSRDHPGVVRDIARATHEGRMVSSVKIEQLADEDDDWLVLEFDGLSPEALFRKRSG